MNRQQRRAQISQERKELAKRAQIRADMEEDVVIKTILDMGCTVLHLEKDDDDITTLRIFKEE